MTIQSTLTNNPDHPKHLLTKNTLKVTLLNLAMINLTSRTAKVRTTEWLSDWQAWFREALASKTKPHKTRLRHSQDKIKENQSKTNARSIPVQRTSNQIHNKVVFHPLESGCKQAQLKLWKLDLGIKSKNNHLNQVLLIYNRNKFRKPTLTKCLRFSTGSTSEHFIYKNKRMLSETVKHIQYNNNSFNQLLLISNKK